MIRVVKNTNETVTFYHPFDIAEVPLTAAGRIGTPAESMPAAGSEVAFTIDSLFETVAEESNEGDSHLTFASSTGATLGNFYLLKGQNGQTAIVEVLRDGTRVQLAGALPFHVQVGDTLHGLAITTTLSTGQTEFTGTGLINCEVSFGAHKVAFQEEFEILNFYPNLSLTWGKLRAAHPIVEIIKPRDGTTTTRDHLFYAWEYTLKPDLAARGIDPECVKSWNVFEPAHALAVVLALTKYNSPNDDERIKEARIEYWQRLKSVLDSPKNWYSDPTNEGGQPAGSPVDMKIRRMVR